jgi:hypothetical protein
LPATWSEYGRKQGEGQRKREQRLYQAGNLLGIRVLEQVVCGDKEYFSFADAGLLTDSLS